jgi:hypothetical protein
VYYWGGGMIIRDLNSHLPKSKHNMKKQKTKAKPEIIMVINNHLKISKYWLLLTSNEATVF